jgi:TIR domain
LNFQYDVFISYGREDHPYATRLSESLKLLAPGYEPFFDTASVRAGDDWENRIERALESSQHLIVLWSDHAKHSDWVSREIYTFNSTAKPKTNRTRRLIFVNLQGMNLAMRAFQQVSRPLLLADYPAIQSVPNETWRDLMRDVEEGLNPLRRPLPVPVVVLTMTEAELADFRSEQWQQISDDFGLPQHVISNRYGPTRADWRPFGGNETIAALLETIKTQMANAFLAFRPYWTSPDDTFWSNALHARSYVKTEFDTGEVAVLIVDPVALHRREVYQRLMFFQESLSSSRVVVLMLPHFNAQPEILRLRSAIMNRGTPYFDDYFQPAVPPRRRLAAQCGWNITDVEDIQRLILAAAVQLGAEADRVSGSTFLRHGS